VQAPTPDVPLNLQSLGTESAFRVLARAEALRRQGKDTVSLAIGKPDAPTPPHIVEAGIAALRDGKHGYTAANGILELREAVSANLHDRYRVAVSPDEIVIVPGGKVTMFFALLAFAEPGSEVVYPDPGFPIYRSLIDYRGATPVPLPLSEAQGFAASAEALAERMSDKTRLVILNSPNNPTGGVTPPAEMDRIAAVLERFPKAAVLSDEIYSQLLYDGAAHRSFLHYPFLRDRLVMLDGFSKCYAMTGWRLGYGIWPAHLVEAVTRLCINSFSCVNQPTQWAGVAALRGPQDCVAELRDSFAARRQLLMDALSDCPGLTIAPVAGAFYLFADIAKTGLTDSEVESRLLEEAGVATLAGSAFGAMGKGFLRLSYAASEENLRRAAARIAASLAQV